MECAATNFAKFITCAEDVYSILRGIKYIVFDIDGVIWSGTTVHPHVRETLKWFIEQKGIKLRFVTNNSMKTRQATVENFHKRGMPFVQKSMVYTSTYGVALQLLSWAKRDGLIKFNKNVFIIGDKGMHEEIREEALDLSVSTSYGYELLFNESDPWLSHYDAYHVVNSVKQSVIPITLPGRVQLGTVAEIMSDIAIPGKLSRKSVEELDVGALVVGLDPNFNNFKLAVAGLVDQVHARKTNGHSLPFIVTNEDPQLPGEMGYLLPGAGTGVSAVCTLLNRRPDFVCGKPYPHIMLKLFENEGIVDPQTVLMVGDRVTTDIAFGRNTGCRTLMVLTGCEGERHIEEADESIKPHFYAKCLGDLWSLGKE